MKKQLKQLKQVLECYEKEDVSSMFNRCYDIIEKGTNNQFIDIMAQSSIDVDGEKFYDPDNLHQALPSV